MIELLRRQGFRPRFGVWELTLACNLRCLHCGSHAGERRDGELSHDECLSIADQLAALGCQRMTLGGGEPTMHPRWDAIGRRLTDRGVRVNLISNGWRWTDEHVRRAQDAGLNNVSFSLDGLEPAHDTIRREGSFARVVGAIERSRRAGIPVSVVTHINRLNYLDLPELRAFLGELGVFAWQLQLGIPSGEMGQHRDDLIVAPRDLLWLVPLIAGLRLDRSAPPEVCPSDNVGYFGRCEKALRDPPEGSRIPFWIGCRAGCEVIGIESNGNVKGCLSLPSARHGQDRFLEGNLRERPLAAIWGREGAFAFNRDFREELLGGFCAVCRYRDICRGGCAWTAYSHTRDRFDNPYCFYRQAVTHHRLDLLGEDQPSEGELAWRG